MTSEQGGGSGQPEYKVSINAINGGVVGKITIGTIDTVVQLASLPMLGLALRNLAKNPEQLGSYLPSVVVGFVRGLTRIQEARTELRAAKGGKVPSLPELAREEAELHRSVPEVRKALEAELVNTQARLDEARERLTAVTDEQARARLSDEVEQIELAMSIQRSLLDSLGPTEEDTPPR